MYDLILKNATIITMDKELSKANWVAVKDKKIAKIGIGECTEDAVEVLDLTGKTVLPGLWDSHMHLLDQGFHLTAINMGGVGSLKEALERIEEGVKKVPAEQEWVIAMDYLAGFVKEQRFPRAVELDTVTGGHKFIMFSPSMHATALNTAAMHTLQIPEDLPGVEKIDGKATGAYLSDTSALASSGAMHENMPRKDILKAMTDAANDAAKNGCTTVQALMGIGNAPADTEVLLENIDNMPINIYVWNQIWDAQKAKDMGLPRVGGCMNLDGASFEHTAAMFDGYTDAPHLRGELYYTDEKVYNFISEAHREGLACTMHAVGERAVEQLMWAYKRVFAEQGRKNLRHRIEHMCFSFDNQIKQFVDMGIVISMQPGFSYYWDVKGQSAFEMVVGDRTARMDNYKRIIEMGGIVCGGSDAPVTPVTPLTWIAHCVRGSNPVRNISLDDAIRMFTINAAYSVNVENEKGSIELGKDADFTVIDRNPYDYVDSDELFQMKNLRTIVGGKTVYAAE